MLLHPGKHNKATDNNVEKHVQKKNNGLSSFTIIFMNFPYELSPREDREHEIAV